MLVTVLNKTLELNQAFTISRGTKTQSESVFVCLRHNGLVGYGEASPNARYEESPGSCMQALALMMDRLGDCPSHYRHALQSIHGVVEGQYAAKAALDMALMDYFGKTQGEPLYKLWGVDLEQAAPTCRTIPIGDPDSMAEQVKAAEQFASLKVKLGGDDDRGMISAIREVTDKPIRVDANEGWTDRDKALADIKWLADKGVELIEQPMPAGQHQDMVWLKQHSPLPLIADEAFTSLQSMAYLADGYHGVNIKLQKCGGTQAAMAAIAIARSLSLDIMMGCMVESSLGIAAAAHLSPLVDYLDLDGHFFLKRSPFDGLRFENGRVLPSDEPGLGMTPNDLILPPETDDELSKLMDRD